MLGAGSFAAGQGPAGFDPVWVATPQSPAPYAAAIEFDPLTQGYPLDENGSAIAVDPVDQKVAMLVGIEFGAVASAPTQFNKLRQLLTRVPASRKPAIARQELNRVLGSLIAAGDITINAVVVSQIARGSDQVFLNYTNNRSGVTPQPMQVA